MCRDEVEEQLCLFLRQAGMANNVKGHWPSAMRKDSAPTKKNLTLIWPAYRGPNSGGYQQEGGQAAMNQTQNIVIHRLIDQIF